jgi:hypothetical protein
MRLRLATAVAPIAAALILPGAAHGAALAVQGACFTANAAVPIAGSGFTPGALVTIAGGATANAVADAAGNVSTQVTAPFSPAILPRVVTITATDTANPANTAIARFPAIREPLATNAPLSGRPSRRATWRFAGFAAGAPIYGHYRFGGRTRATHRFGLASGPCGTLTVRARRVPLRASSLRTGRWTLQLDQRRTYSPTAPRRVVRFRLFRTFT